MRIIAIAAVADNGVIGSGHGMLWHLPGDFKRFKRVTMGHTLVLGRRTFEEIGLLPGRRTVVVTRDPGWSHDGVDAVRSVPEALALAAAATSTTSAPHLPATPPGGPWGAPGPPPGPPSTRA